MLRSPCFFFFFFFNDTATTEIYTLSLHDALPISRARCRQRCDPMANPVVIDFLVRGMPDVSRAMRDRKSTRLNSSHQIISYAVFCLKKKKHIKYTRILMTIYNLPTVRVRM